MELKLDGRTVTVDDTFRDLSPVEQKASLEKIHVAMNRQAATETTAEDVAQGVGTGAIVGGLMGGTGAGVAGLINDAVQYPTQYGYRAIDAVLGTDLAERHERSTGGYMGTTRALTENAEKLAANIVDPPVSKGGKIAQAVTSGGVEALAGSGLFRVGGRIFSSYDDAVKFAEQAGVNPAVAATIKEMAQTPVVQGVYGAAAGGGGEFAQQNDVHPLFGTIAGLGVAVAGHTAASAGKTAVRNTLADFDENLQRTEPAQQRAAAERLRTSATDRPALEEWARRGETGELVPGSKPTLFEATGDTGIGGQENRAFQQGTELDRETGATFKTAMEERRTQQNAARLAEIESAGGEGRKAAVLDEFRQQRDALDRTTAEAETVAQSGADTAAARAGTAATAEEVGSALRDPMVTAQRDVKAEGNKLYDAIGAEGVTVGTGRLKAVIAQHYRDIAENPLSHVEKQTADLVKSYGPQRDFNLLKELRTSLTSRAADQGLSLVERFRAKQLRNAIDQAMDDGLARAIESDSNLFQRVADTMAAPPGLEAGDAGATQRLREANRFWRERVKEPYGAKPVEAIVKDARTPSGFKMTEAAVPEAAFRPGPTGAEHVRALRAAGATDAALTDAAALSFQQKVIRDGAVNPNDFRRWAHNHAAAISELPAAVQRRFLSAADATATLRDATAKRLADLHDFDQSAVGKVLGIPEQDLEKAIKSYLETTSQAEKLAEAVAGNAEAQAGLRRLAADYIVRQFTGASDDISKASLTTWLKRNRGGMEAIFGKEGATRFQRLSDDIERSRKQMTVGKDPAGSSTAGNLASMVKPAAGATVMTLLAHALGPKGLMVAGALKSVASNMKLAGMADVDSLFARALLDPELARKLLTKAPALKNEKFRKGLGTTILRSSLAGMAYGGNQ
jgi:hypothetical protein